MYWGMPLILRQAVYNCALAFTFSLYHVSRSARGETLGTSQFFIVHARCAGHTYRPRHVHSPTHRSCLLDSQIYVKAFQRPSETNLISQLLKYFGLLQRLSSPQEPAMLSDCH